MGINHKGGSHGIKETKVKKREEKGRLRMRKEVLSEQQGLNRDSQHLWKRYIYVFI
jgi:hypothetical protein